MNKKIFFIHYIIMFTLIIRAIICYLLVLLVFRIMGKRQIGEMQPFELVLTLIIADLATIPMAESSVPTLHGVVPLITLVVVHFFLSFFSKKSQAVSKLLNGKPIIIINPNGIDHVAINNLNITIEDIFEALRGKGFFSLEQIEYAIMETNGNVNVMPKSSFAPATCGDLKLEVEGGKLPTTLIAEGKIIEENLKLLNITEGDLKYLISKANADKIEEILVLTLDDGGMGYIQKIGEKFITFQTERKGGQAS